MYSYSDSNEDSYLAGLDEGRTRGYNEGWEDANRDFEPRIARYWAELQTLNARISYLERLTGGTSEG